MTQMNSRESLLAFFNNIFDEAVLAGSAKALLTAAVARSLRAATGDQCFATVVRELESTGKIKLLFNIETAEHNHAIIEVLDYVSK